jgi:hypothetical protein
MRPKKIKARVPKTKPQDLIAYGNPNIPAPIVPVNSNLKPQRERKDKNRLIR